MELTDNVKSLLGKRARHHNFFDDLHKVQGGTTAKEQSAKQILAVLKNRIGTKTKSAIEVDLADLGELEGLL